MYEVKLKSDFAAAHNLREVGGKCEFLHGHNFIVEVTVESETLDPQGMVVDFRLLKTKLNQILEVLDHRYLNELPRFSQRNPSAENLAVFICDELAAQIDQGPVRVRQVSIWESENSQATYRRP
jgi:6-pyruvoyltetrahydropterin/6-carboxytetrahydropterin synthase